ncbi:MAG: methyltransferase [Desulfobulbaceae bacterium]|jgi:predicted nicotinamide N-methyase|nr:methyltransferase [Desulfobulbaceae bacterium]
MDFRHLPDEERKLYLRLSQTHRLRFEPVAIADTHLSILQIADLEEFLGGQDPFEDVSAFPFWVKLWDAAIILAYLLRQLPKKPGQTMLELGAGLGVPGLTAQAAGFAVTLSDYEEIILDFQRVSAAASGLPQARSVMLDWLKPPELGQFSVLAGAEILFREEFFQPLLAVFKRYLAPGGQIFLAHDASRRSLPKFLAAAEKDYRITVNEQKIKRDDKEIAIIVNRLVPRGPENA